MSKVILLVGLIAILFVLIGIFRNRKKPIKIVLLIICFYVMAGGVSYLVTDRFFPVAKNPVTIELNNFSEDADSVFLSEVEIDGEIYEIDRLEEGNWIWQNHTYGWKNAKNIVIDDISQSIAVKIPVGYSRRLTFTVDATNVGCIITEDSRTKEIELTNGRNSVELESSTKVAVYGYKLGKVGCYFAIYLLWVLIIELIIRNSRVVLQLVKKRRFYITLAIVAFLSFLCMILSSDVESFWYDEVYTIGWLQDGSPLSSMFIVFELLGVWLNIMPYGQAYLLLLSEILVVLSVVLSGMVGKQIRNEQTGIYAAILVGFSSYIINNAAFEFRSYSFLLFFSTLTFYLFVIRGKSVKYNYGIIVAYGLSLMLLMDSHEYGKVVTGIYIFIDFILILGRKLKKRNAVSWLFPIGYMIYWLNNNLVGGLWNNYSWPANPNFEVVTDTFLSLCGGRYEILALFIIGAGFAIKIVVEYLVNQKKYEQVINYAVLIVTLAGTFGASIFYSNIINPENSLYVNRYFISIIFNIFLLAAVGLDILLQAIMRGYKTKHKIAATYTCAVAMILFCWMIFLKTPSQHYEDFRGTAEWVKAQENVYDKDVLVYIPESPYHCMGWMYYFKDGKDNNEPNFANSRTLDISHTDYDTIYVIKFKVQPTVEQQQWLDENYTLARQVSGYPISIYKKK